MGVKTEVLYGDNGEIQLVLYHKDNKNAYLEITIDRLDGSISVTFYRKIGGKFVIESDEIFDIKRR